MDFARSPEEIFSIAISGPIAQQFKLRDQQYISDSTLTNILLMAGITTEKIVGNSIIYNIPTKYDATSDNILRILLTYGSFSVIAKIIRMVENLDAWTGPTLPAPLFISEWQWNNLVQAYPITSLIYNFSDPESYTIDYLVRLIKYEDYPKMQWQLRNLSRVPVNSVWLDKLRDLVIQMPKWTDFKILMENSRLDSWLPWLTISSNDNYPSLLWFILIIRPTFVNKLSWNQQKEVCDYLAKGFINLDDGTADYNACMLTSRLYKAGYSDLKEIFSLEPQFFKDLVNAIQYTGESVYNEIYNTYIEYFLVRLSSKFIKKRLQKLVTFINHNIRNPIRLNKLNFENYTPSLFRPAKIDTPDSYFQVINYIVAFTSVFGYNQYLFREILYLNDRNLIGFYLYLLGPNIREPIEDALTFALAGDRANILQILKEQYLHNYYVIWNSSDETWSIEDKDKLIDKTVLRERLEVLSDLINPIDPYLAAEIFQMESFKPLTIQGLVSSLKWKVEYVDSSVTPYLINNIINQYKHSEGGQGENIGLTKFAINLILKQAISFDKAGLEYSEWVNEYNDGNPSLFTDPGKLSDNKDPYDEIVSLAENDNSLSVVAKKMNNGHTYIYQLLAAMINLRYNEGMRNRKYYSLTIELLTKLFDYISSDVVWSYVRRLEVSYNRNIIYYLICFVKSPRNYNIRYNKKYYEELGYFLRLVPSLEISKYYLEHSESFKIPGLEKETSTFTHDLLLNFIEYITLSDYYILYLRGELEEIIDLYKSINYGPNNETYFDYICRKMFIDDNKNMFREIFTITKNYISDIVNHGNRNATINHLSTSLIATWNILTSNCKPEIWNQRTIKLTTMILYEIYAEFFRYMNRDNISETKTEIVKYVADIFTMVIKDNFKVHRVGKYDLKSLLSCTVHILSTNAKLLGEECSLDSFNGLFYPIKYLLSVIPNTNGEYIDIATEFAIEYFKYFAVVKNIPLTRRLYQNIFDPRLVNWAEVKSKMRDPERLPQTLRESGININT